MLVLDETSILSKSDFSVTICYAFALRTSQVYLVGNLSWFFRIDRAHQLFHMGFKLALLPAVLYDAPFVRLVFGF